ncbi:SDR family oxidoreductase [Catenovulum sp. SM1970]|uniref:SDR family oxidoreductase n=1 Tax=Marinifaba aquimaris TaxID=2741323 RepID=UPI001574762F|nr:SDR family oxidoreductase [Marinifaba aquimaris]NTS76109.1 SDR family oxidoreductase [Marinifaba aquimaris]
MSIIVKGKTALVTGANRGIGRDIAIAFLNQGAEKVYLAVRNRASVNDLVNDYPGQFEALEVDVTNPNSVQALAASAQDVNIVINNAAVLAPSGVFDDNVFDSFEQELNVNTLGLLRMARAFAPVLEANKTSTFIQLNSIVSFKSFDSVATYSASKAASYSFTLSVKNEFEQKGIQVHSVHPGPIATDMSEQAGVKDIGEPSSVVADDIIDVLENNVFLSFPDEIAK